MARFEQGFRTLVTGAQAILEIIAGASGRVRLVEMGLTINAQTQAALGLDYPGTIGQTPTSPVTFLTQNADSSATVAQLALGWTTPPTAPTNGYYFRRATIPAAQSFPLVWAWPAGGGMVILPSTSLALYLFATGPALDGWIVLEQ